MAKVKEKKVYWMVVGVSFLGIEYPVAVNFISKSEADDFAKEADYLYVKKQGNKPISID